MLNVLQDYSKTEALLQELVDLIASYDERSRWGADSFAKDALQSYLYLQKRRAEGSLSQQKRNLRMTVSSMIRSLRHDFDYKVKCEIFRPSPRSAFYLTFQTNPTTNEWGDINSLARFHSPGLSKYECTCICLCLNILSALFSELSAMEAVETPGTPPLRAIAYNGMYCFPE